MRPSDHQRNRLTSRRPFRNRAFLLVIALFFLGLAAVGVVIRLRLVGPAAGWVVVGGGVLALLMYLVAWNETLVRAGIRLQAAGKSDRSRDAALLFLHLAIAVGTVAAMLVGLLVAGAPVR